MKNSPDNMLKQVFQSLEKWMPDNFPIIGNFLSKFSNHWKLLFAFIILHSSFSSAQWLTQEIALEPGWNAVWLNVQPVERCDEVFWGTAVEMVWKWDGGLFRPDFRTTPGDLGTHERQWFCWRPESSGLSALNTLFGLEANTGYMIKLREDAEPVIWSVKGAAVAPMVEWRPNAFNLCGFPVMLDGPSFAAFFADCDEVNAVVGSDALFAVGPAGEKIPIRSTAHTHVERGKAYWVKADNPRGFMGPLEMRAGRSIHFSDQVPYSSVKLRNITDEPLNVVLTLRESEAAPVGEPQVAGVAYALARRGMGDWVDLQHSAMTLELAAGRDAEVSLALNIEALSAVDMMNANGAVYAALLQVEVPEKGMLFYLPMSAEVPQVKRQTESTTRSRSGTVSATDSPYQGLWVGKALISEVSAPYYSATELLATEQQFPLRLLVHIDGAGYAYLMQSVVLAVEKEGGADASIQLYTDAGAVPSTMDMIQLASAAFPPFEPMNMGLVDSLTAGVLTGRVEVGCNDPVNPFLSVYNPQHDNRSPDGVTYTNAVESYSITRDLSLTFEEPDTEQPIKVTWGSTTIAGTYAETLQGVRRESILTSGPFILSRISTNGAVVK